MQKNVVLACGLGDLFTFLTRLDDFFEKNEEYSSIMFWLWLHTPKLAKELVSLDKHDVGVYSLEDMHNYLEGFIPKQHIEKARTFFVKQNSGGVGVESYLKFISNFFPNLEQWVHLPTYEKYRSTFPYRLEHAPVSTREKPYLVVHPYSTTVKTEKPERMWAPKRWGAFIKMIRDYYGEYEVVLIGKKTDMIEGPRDFPGGTVDLRGKTTLTEAISLVYGASGVVGTNSWATLMSVWADIPTYAQWFVQEQLIPTHHPRPVGSLKNLAIETSKNNKQPSANEAWNTLRELFDATVIV